MGIALPTYSRIRTVLNFLRESREKSEKIKTKTSYSENHKCWRKNVKIEMFAQKYQQFLCWTRSSHLDILSHCNVHETMFEVDLKDLEKAEEAIKAAKASTSNYKKETDVLESINKVKDDTSRLPGSDQSQRPSQESSSTWKRPKNLSRLSTTVWMTPIQL